MKRKWYIAAVFAFLLGAAGCRTEDDDPFADLSPADKKAPKTEKKTKGSLMEHFSMEHTERAKYKARLRDVSRPMDENTSQSRTFPWRTDNSSRSETLHEGMRSGAGPSYYDW